MDAVEEKVEMRRIGRLINRIQNRAPVTPEEVKSAFSWILSSASTSANFLWGSMFSALMTRGVTYLEMRALLDAATAYDQQLVHNNGNKPRLLSDRSVIAITGSGKDNYKTFNLSTAAAMVASSLGVCVIKPGSSALSSNSGALDILSHLGIRLIQNEAALVDVASRTNLCIFSFVDRLAKYGGRYGELFFSYHPLSYIMPAIAIPYQVDGIVYGIADNNVELGAELLRSFNYPFAAVVSTEVKLNLFTDEFIPFGVARAAIVSGNEIVLRTYKHHEINDDEEDSLTPGFSHEENAGILLHALAGRRGPAATQAIARGASLILMGAGKARSITDGVEQAQKAIESGQVVEHVYRYAEATRNAEETSSE